MYALEIKDLKKTYSNKVEALKGIDLNVSKGDFFFIGSEWSRQINCDRYYLFIGE